MEPNVIPWEQHFYNPLEYPFSDLVAGTIGEDINFLEADLERRTWETDQKSPWHARFYEGFNLWSKLYDRFVQKVIGPLVDEPCYYQRVPTFRVHLPGNVAVGEFHTDAQYNHPVGETSFWVPLTPAHGTSSLWIEDDDGIPLCVYADRGDIIAFNAVARRHGNFVNTTGRSRVSFDFRLLPVTRLPEVPGEPTMHTKMRFIPGEYYATGIVGPP